MMAEIFTKRKAITNKEWKQSKDEHPWRRLNKAKLKRVNTDFARIEEAGLAERMPGGKRHLTALKAWLSGMAWTPEEDVTNAELAVDFEVWSGLDLIGLGNKGGVPPLNDRARMIYRMIKLVIDACESAGTSSPIPGKRCQVHSLNSVGGNGLMGFRCRPEFRGGEETMKVLEDQLPLTRHGFNHECWGHDIFPAYHAERNQRALQWPVGVERQQPQTRERDPLRIPEGTEPAPNGKHVCGPHQKTICGKCAASKSTLAECCDQHHHEGDGLAIRFCTQHRMTRCSNCSTLVKCCGYGHHVCLRHSKPTCASCLSLPDLKSRRPGRCCLRGHHEGEPIDHRTARVVRRKKKRADSSDEDDRPASKRPTTVKKPPPKQLPVAKRKRGKIDNSSQSSSDSCRQANAKRAKVAPKRKRGKADNSSLSSSDSCRSSNAKRAKAVRASSLIADGISMTCDSQVKPAAKPAKHRSVRNKR